MIFENSEKFQRSATADKFWENIRRLSLRGTPLFRKGIVATPNQLTPGLLIVLIKKRQ